MKKIVIIGFGNMGEAMAAGLAGNDFSIEIVEKRPERVSLAKDRYRISAVDAAAVSTADIIIVAVKPQDFFASAPEFKTRCGNALVISIMAGIPIKKIRDALGAHAVARFMPNLAALYGQAAVGVSFACDVNSEQKKRALEIAGAAGKPFELPEKLMSAFTGLSGSGIAYVFSFMHSMALGGTRAGIPYGQSIQIALQTLQGAVTACSQTGEDPLSLLSKVISPAGTTIEGVYELESGGFSSSVIKAVGAAAKRAGELENT